jgi:hypothetical protein
MLLPHAAGPRTRGRLWTLERHVEGSRSRGLAIQGIRSVFLRSLAPHMRKVLFKLHEKQRVESHTEWPWKRVGSAAREAAQRAREHRHHLHLLLAVGPLLLIQHHRGRHHALLAACVSGEGAHDVYACASSCLHTCERVGRVHDEVTQALVYPCTAILDVRSCPLGLASVATRQNRSRHNM